MAINNFSTDLNTVNVNGRVMTDWGESDPAITEDDIDPQSVLRRGQGGNGVRLDRINPGKSVVLNLNPGSADSAFMQSLLNSKATIVYGRTQVGTLEAVLGRGGVIVSKGQVGRGGQTITDDQYTIEFNSWTESAGGA
jgi:hypothetical protein